MKIWVQIPRAHVSWDMVAHVCNASIPIVYGRKRQETSPEVYVPASLVYASEKQKSCLKQGDDKPEDVLEPPYMYHGIGVCQ